jgi:branched-chain amino acid transport system ATP-binding protein
VTPILKTTGLTKTFGAVTAANALDVSIETGSVVGLIGGNGAGKTTFINLVTGYLKPTSGTVHFDGRDITGQPPRHITRLGLCRSFQIPQVFDSLTAYENLLVGMGIVSMGRKAFVGSALGHEPPEVIAEEMLQRFRLGPYRDQLASTLPEGVRKLLDIAMALAVKPRILLLDEPTSGVSADEKFTLMDLVLEAILAAGVTVLFVEHDMEVVRRYVQRILAFYEGRIIADGDPEVVLRDDEVIRYVIGTSHASATAKGPPHAAN